VTDDLAARRSKIVLGIDDQAENLMLLKAMINRAGYSFFGVSSGVEALGLCHRLTPRLILLDIQMPEMDGVRTCQKLREMTVLDHVPIAFLTARKTAEDITRGINAGGSDFIVKPFDPLKLLERVEYWTNRRV
jgi:DNA-binding response OmpR family regulator